MRLIFGNILPAAALALLWTWPAAAAEPPVLPQTGAPDLFGAGVKVTGVLALLIGGLLLALYLLRRFGAGRSNLFGGRDLIRIIGTRALAPKKFIALVEVGGSVLTLGVTEDRITRLDKTPAEEFRSQVGGLPGPGAEGGFSERLRALAGSTGSKGREP